MINVARPKEPAILAKNKAAWLADLSAAVISTDKNLINTAQKKYGHAQVKQQLENMFFEKCAYCESHINVVTSGHIEHFRPKSRFRSQTFEWKNLLLSCPTCNNTRHKGDKFPSVHAGGRLIDPSSEDPSIHFDFVFDPTSRQALVAPKTRRGRTSAIIFGLNTRKALIKARSSLIKKLLALKTYETTDNAARELIAEAKGLDQPYLAWVRALI